MRKAIIAGNWKMYGSKQSVKELLEGLILGYRSVSAVEWIVFPPFVFLEQSEQLLKKSTIAWGAQDVSLHAEGAYTGEISPTMLKEFGCKYVIVGHSERRTFHDETNELVAAKFASAVQFGLKPILCLGETEEQRASGKTFKIIEEQLAPVLAILDNLSAFQDAAIAYEPVWAIGTGKHATPETAEQVHAYIRQLLAKRAPEVAENVRILYGGSVKPDNAASLFAMPNIDGALVGGASLDANKFIEIGKKWNN